MIKIIPPTIRIPLKNPNTSPQILFNQFIFTYLAIPVSILAKKITATIIRIKDIAKTICGKNFTDGSWWVDKQLKI
jgi:hypothetical protein